VETGVGSMDVGIMVAERSFSCQGFGYIGLLGPRAARRKRYCTGGARREHDGGSIEDRGLDPSLE
jgi:hypothetical protein